MLYRVQCNIEFYERKKYEDIFYLPESLLSQKNILNTFSSYNRLIWRNIIITIKDALRKNVLKFLKFILGVKVATLSFYENV